MTNTRRGGWLIEAGLLLLCWPLSAQVKWGDLSAHLSGIVSPGYSAEYGNQTSSDHSWTFGGAGTLTGVYYNPNFLTFNSSFYLNQSRANSNFQSISNASGVTASTNLFGGSHFPGSIDYSYAYNSEGNYAVPGLPNYVTHGNSNTFGINWGENLPNAPSFSAGFQMGSSSYTVYGANDEGTNSFHSINLHSGYTLEGFSMGAWYINGGSHALIPQVVSNFPSATTESSSDGEGFNVTHLLPMQGSVSGSVSRSSWDTSYLGETSSGTIDLYTVGAAAHPSQKVALTFNTTYSDNLSGQLLQAISAAGGVIPGLNSNESSNSLDVMGVVTYSPLQQLQTSALVERRSQSFLGQTYGVTSYGGTAGYMQEVLDGTFNVSASIIENTSDQNTGNTLGFSTNGTYSREILGWHVNGSFGYAQNAETLLVTYMNSFYNYSGTVRRRWGQFNLSAGGGGSRTALTQQPGTTSSSDTYDGSLGYGRWVNVNGSYSRASGQALTTGGGLIPVPIPSPVLPSSLISLYGGKSYTLGLSSTPAKNFIFAAAYAKATSNVASGGLASMNQNEEFNTLLQYQMRKLFFTSGYARLEQGFSGSGLPPGIVASYYAGVSRWFNFF